MSGEFDAIRRHFTYPAPGSVLGVGDDAALLRVAPRMELAVSADMLVSGRHFLPDAAPEALGHKTLAVNLSDMAAMGAAPRWATLAIALPRLDDRWLAAFMRGFMRLARRHGTDLVGGDTTRGPLTLSVQIMGEVPRGAALRRDGARAGDDVWVSGTLGDAALALAALDGRVDVPKPSLARLRQRLDRPTPRVALGLALRGVARSAIDVSDGLVGDLGHICERSGLAAEVDVDALPKSTALKACDDARAVRAAQLAGGDDYELCFTAPRAARAAVRAAAREVRVPVACIGRMLRGAARVRVLSAGRELRLPRGGYDHFR